MQFLLKHQKRGIQQKLNAPFQNSVKGLNHIFRIDKMIIEWKVS